MVKGGGLARYREGNEAMLAGYDRGYVALYSLYIYGQVVAGLVVEGS